MKLALSPDNQWDIDFGELIPLVGSVGFAGLGCPANQAAAHTHQRYVKAGLACHEMTALFITENASRTVAYAARLAQAAAMMSAPWVNTVFVAPPTGEVAETIGRCAAVLADSGSAMAVEFSPAGTIPDIAAGLEVVEIAGHGAALLVDAWHFTHGPSTWEQLAALPGDKIAYIQFTDATHVESNDLFDETVNRRALPGDGIVDVERFADVIRGIGFDGYVSVEVLSRPLRARPVPEAVRTLFETSARYWR